MQSFPEKCDLCKIPDSGICQIIKKLISWHRKFFPWNKSYEWHIEKLREGSENLFDGKKNYKELTPKGKESP